MTMPATETELPSHWWRMWERARELEWMIENRPASPAQREAWAEELELLDADICAD